MRRHVVPKDGLDDRDLFPRSGVRDIAASKPRGHVAASDLDRVENGDLGSDISRERKQRNQTRQLLSARPVIIQLAAVLGSCQGAAWKRRSVPLWRITADLEALSRGVGPKLAVVAGRKACGAVEQKRKEVRSRKQESKQETSCISGDSLDVGVRNHGRGGRKAARSNKRKEVRSRKQESKQENFVASGDSLCARRRPKLGSGAEETCGAVEQKKGGQIKKARKQARNFLH